jgi:ABC-2 type transport system permease protein
MALRFFRDGLPLLLLLAAATAGAEMMFMGALGEFSDQDRMFWMEIEFVRRIMQTLLGAELTPDVSATGLMSFGFSHPLIYAFSWSYILTAATRVPAAEIERGTADLLLALPVTRAGVYVSASMSLLAGAVVLTLATLVGCALGDRLVPLWESLDFSRLRVVAVNLLALHMCVGAAALAVSAWSSRRGAAVAVVLGWLLACFLLEFLGQFSETARSLEFLGVLHYYRPLPQIRAAGWPWANLAVLLSAAAAYWTVGLVRFARRDVPSV